jgi:LytS/YehU family sensor histidine kinase
MLIYKIPSFRINFSDLIGKILLGLIFGLAGAFIFTIYHLSEERKIKQLELKQEQTKAELRALVSQINPHFLFNTLNSISALIHISPEKADAMVQKLANLFRYSLQSGKNRFVSLRNELEIVRQYLEIEKIRFAERLRFKIEFEPECETASIPPLLLQTLVENSIKHGVSPMLEGGEIFIKAKLKNNNIEIFIEDNGKGFPDNPKTIGFGLNAVQNILELQFKKQHQFNINNENGVKIHIKIPYIKFTGKENDISNNNN